MTPGMVRSSRLAIDLDSALRLPDEVIRAAAAGLVTGSKALVNGSATAVKNVATLGFMPGQLELIGVTEEDRARGYDTAVAISTASGEVLIAVGTGGITSALSKGGTIARAASGALVAFDAAGNAVGVMQGAIDAATNGVTLNNGAQIAGGLLGLAANYDAARKLGKSISPPSAPAEGPPANKQLPTEVPGPKPKPHAKAATPSSEFVVAKHGDMPTPRPGKNSHHGVMSEWMKRHFPGYNAGKAPAILMPENNHRATFGVYLRWRARMKQFFWGANSTGARLPRNRCEAFLKKCSMLHECRKTFDRNTGKSSRK